MNLLLCFFLFFLFETSQAIKGYKLDSTTSALSFDISKFATTQIPNANREISAIGPNATIFWWWTPTNENKLHQGGGAVPGHPTILREFNNTLWNVGEESSADISDAPTPNPSGCNFQLKFTSKENCAFNTETVIYFVCDQTVVSGTSFMEYYGGDLSLCNIQMRVRTNCTAWATPYGTLAPTTSSPTTIAPTTLAPTIAPTTVPPTTLAPTTVTPTTASPTTVEITTTNAPTTVEPTIAPTTTVEPTTQAPTDAPTTSDPYDEPTTSVPVETTTEAPTTVIETTTIEPTTTETPTTTMEPTTESPTTIEPTTETPSTTTEPTTTIEPTTTSAPTTTLEPTTTAATTLEPTTSAPTTTFEPTLPPTTTTMPTTTVEPTTEISSTSSPTTVTPTTLPPTTTTMSTTLPPTTEPPTPSTSNIIQSVNNTDSLSVFATLKDSSDAFLRSNKDSDSVETAKISISFQKVNTDSADPVLSSFKESEAKAVIPGSIISSVSSQPVIVTFQMIQGNPFSQVSNVSVYSPVVGLSVGNIDGTELSIRDSKDLINLTIPVLSTSLPSDQEYVCLYWSEEKQSWESDGLITSTSQSSTVVCSTSHLTNFTLGSKSKIVAQPAILEPNSPSSSSLHVGAIVGIVVGGVVLIVVVAVVAFFTLKRTKKGNQMATDIESIVELPQYDGLNIQGELGKGAYGQVMLAIQSDSTPVAIKKLSQNGDSRLFYHEANQISKLHHPNIVQFLRLNKNEQFFVMEYLPGGNLLSFIQKEGSLLTELQKMRMLKNLVNALAYLEEMKVVHRDVACRNILMSQNDVSATLKLGDFGLSVEAGTTVPSYMTEKLPVRWSAPESFTSKTFFTNSDVWSFGVVVFEMFENGKIPYGQLSNEGVQALVSKGGRLDLFSVPPSLEQLVLRCWEQNPTKRPTFRKIGEEIQSMIKDLSYSPQVSISSPSIYRKTSQTKLSSSVYESRTKY